MPCDRCQSHNLPCAFDTVRKRRGPRPGTGRVINELRVSDSSRSQTESVPLVQDPPQVESINIEQNIQNHQSNTGASPRDLAGTTCLYNGIPKQVRSIHSGFSTQDNESSPQSLIDDAYFTFDDFAQNVLSSTLPLQGQRLTGDSSLSSIWNRPENATAADHDIFSPATSWYEIEHGVNLFFDRMYAVYPVVDERYLRSLLDDRNSLRGAEARLLWSICALTLMAVDAWPSMNLEKRTLAARRYIRKCLEDRISSPYIEDVAVEDVLTSLFIAVTYFDLKCRKNAWFYVREAITLAQAAGTDTVERDMKLQPAERLRRQRIYALLYISERGACIHDTFPVSILSAPELLCDRLPGEDLSVSTGLNLLFHLFSLLDLNYIQARNKLSLSGGTDKEYVELAMLQEQLCRDLDLTNVSEVQRADVLITQQWLRLMVWQTALRLGLISSTSINPSYSYSYPIQIASSLQDVLKTLPSIAIEVHGLGIVSRSIHLHSSSAKGGSNCDCKNARKFSESDAVHIDALIDTLSMGSRTLPKHIVHSHSRIQTVSSTGEAKSWLLTRAVVRKAI